MGSVVWQKSSYSSEGNNCVELGSSAQATNDVVFVRESDESGVVLASSRARTAGLLAAVRAGKLGRLEP